MVDLSKKGPLVERAKKDAASFINFMNRISLKNFKEKLTSPKSCPSKIGFIALFALLLFIFVVLPIFFIAVGLVNLSSCASQAMIPIFLIVFGAVVLANVLFNFVGLGIVAFKFKVEPIQRIIDFLVIAFIFIWTIIGSIWVFGISSIMNNGYSGCDKFCYMLAFWLLIVLWTLFVLAIFLFIGFKIVKQVYSRFKK